MQADVHAAKVNRVRRLDGSDVCGGRSKVERLLRSNSRLCVKLPKSHGLLLQQEAEKSLDVIEIKKGL